MKNNLPSLKKILKRNEYGASGFLDYRFELLIKDIGLWLVTVNINFLILEEF